MTSLQSDVSTRVSLVCETRSQAFLKDCEQVIQDLARRGITRSGIVVSSTVGLSETYYKDLAELISQQLERGISAPLYPWWRFERTLIQIGDAAIDRATHDINVRVERSFEISGAERVPLVSLKEAENHARSHVRSSLRMRAKELRRTKLPGIVVFVLPAGGVFAGMMWLAKWFLHLFQKP